MKVSDITPISQSDLECHLGCEYSDESHPPLTFTFEGDDGCSGICVADDVGIEVTINDATGNYICLALERDRTDCNRAIQQVVRATAMNCFGGRLFATTLALMGFVKAI